MTGDGARTRVLKGLTKERGNWATAGGIQISDGPTLDTRTRDLDQHLTWTRMGWLMDLDGGWTRDLDLDGGWVRDLDLDGGWMRDLDGGWTRTRTEDGRGTRTEDGRGTRTEDGRGTRTEDGQDPDRGWTTWTEDEQGDMDDLDGGWTRDLDGGGTTWTEDERGDMDEGPRRRIDEGPRRRMDEKLGPTWLDMRELDNGKGVGQLGRMGTCRKSKGIHEQD